LDNNTLSGLLELDLDEHKFGVVRIDDVMFDASRTRIGLTECKLVFHWSCFRFSQQRSGCQAHHDVIVTVAMPPGFGARFKPPLGDDDAVVFL